MERPTRIPLINLYAEPWGNVFYGIKTISCVLDLQPYSSVPETFRNNVIVICLLVFLFERTHKMEDKELPGLTIDDLPFKAVAKYLGNQPAKGLWGIKHTRKPVDLLVCAAKSLPPNEILPIVELTVHLNGLSFVDVTHKKRHQNEMEFGIDAISYGVQDLVYTRVFSIIVVTSEDLAHGTPFVCHSFVCESRAKARQITYALAAAFQDYGVKTKGQSIAKKFAIDLRSPEELQQEQQDEETEA